MEYNLFIVCLNNALLYYVFNAIMLTDFTGWEVEEAGRASWFRRLESHCQLSTCECVCFCVYDCL